MPLHAPSDDPERLLVYGSQSAGKTTMWMSIADLAQKTKSDAHFYVIDNDKATGRFLENPRGSYNHLENVTVFKPTSIDDYEGITERILNDIQDDDWIIPDMLSNVWKEMPDWWHENVFGENPWDYWKATRKAIVETEGGHERQFGGDSGVDWQYIGKVYRSWEKQITLTAPCHVFATSSETEIQDRYDKTGELQAEYAIASNFQPQVEKNTKHRFHTIIRVTRRAEGRGRSKSFTRKMTMVKDREREEIWTERGGKGLTVELSDPPNFGLDYLVKIAGWSLGKVK